MYDPLIQYEAYVTFATYAPGFGQLQNNTVLQQINQSYYESGGCQDQEEACYAAGNSTASNDICRNGYNYCVGFISLRHLKKKNFERSTMCSFLQLEISTRTISGKIRWPFSLQSTTSTSFTKHLSRVQSAQRYDTRNALMHPTISL